MVPFLVVFVPFCKTASKSSFRLAKVSLPAANLSDLARQGLVFVFEVLASLLAGSLRFLLGAVGEVRLQHGPPTVVELGPFLPAEHGAALGDVTVRNERVLQTLRVASEDAAEEVIHPLQDDGVVAREILESQVGSLAGYGVEEHRGTEGGVRPSVFVGDGEEGRKAVGGILLQAP